MDMMDRRHTDGPASGGSEGGGTLRLFGQMDDGPDRRGWGSGVDGHGRWESRAPMLVVVRRALFVVSCLSLSELEEK